MWIKKLLLIAAANSAVRLESLLPICVLCKKVRDEPGYWQGVEQFIQDRVDIKFTHGICPECMDKQFADHDAVRAAFSLSS